MVTLNRPQHGSGAWNCFLNKWSILLVQPFAIFCFCPFGGRMQLGSLPLQNFEHLVVVPYDSLKLVGDKIVLPGGTKETLKMQSEFEYAAK